MKTLTITKDQVAIIASLSEQELEDFLIDIRSLYQLSNLTKLYSSLLKDTTIKFDGRHDIDMRMVTPTDN